MHHSHTLHAAKTAHSYDISFDVLDGKPADAERRANEAHAYIMDMIDQLAGMAKKAGHMSLANDLRAITSQFKIAD